jgi:hypothetical protein
MWTRAQLPYFIYTGFTGMYVNNRSDSLYKFVIGIVKKQLIFDNGVLEDQSEAF